MRIYIYRHIIVDHASFPPRRHQDCDSEGIARGKYGIEYRKFEREKRQQ